MSEVVGSGWDDLQYPYGLLNIKGSNMPSYPNFVRGNTKVSVSSNDANSKNVASLNMTSEITPFFNSRLEIINVKKFVEDGGIAVLDPDKTYVIRMPKVVITTKDNQIDYEDGKRIIVGYSNYCEGAYYLVGKIEYEYTFFIRPLQSARMSLNTAEYSKNEAKDVDEFPYGTPENFFQSFSSGNDLSTIGIRCWRSNCQTTSARNIVNTGILSSDSDTMVYENYEIYGSTCIKSINQTFFQKVVKYSNYGGSFKFSFINTPLSIFTEKQTLDLEMKANGSLISMEEIKLQKGNNCPSGGWGRYLNTISTDKRDKTKLPHTLTYLCNFSAPGKIKLAEKRTAISMLFNSMFKFENVATSPGGTPGLVMIPLLNITY